jgi:hypothetical protein
MTIIAPPPPAPEPTPALRPGRRSAVRIALVAAAAVLVLTYVAALGLAAGRLNALSMTVESKDLPAGMRSLTIDSADANVRVTVDGQAGGAKVDLRTIDSTGDRVERLEINSDGGDTRIRLTPDVPSFIDWGRSDEITVTLPPQLAKGLSVTTQQSDGTVTVDADLDRLTAHTSDGSVMLNGNARRIDVTTRDGDVVAQRPISIIESFSAQTVDGDVHVQFGNAAPRTVDASSRDGDVMLALPSPGPYLVDVSADSQRVRVPETTNASMAAAAVTVRTVDGSVVIDTSGAAR